MKIAIDWKLHHQHIFSPQKTPELQVLFLTRRQLSPSDGLQVPTCLWIVFKPLAVYITVKRDD